MKENNSKMKKLTFKFLLPLLLLGFIGVPNSFGSQIMQSQNKALAMAVNSLNLNKEVEAVVSGTVTDAQSGEPLPGVTIQVKGTTNGTISGEMAITI